MSKERNALVGVAGASLGFGLSAVCAPPAVGVAAVACLVVICVGLAYYAGCVTLARDDAHHDMLFYKKAYYRARSDE